MLGEVETEYNTILCRHDKYLAGNFKLNNKK